MDPLRGHDEPVHSVVYSPDGRCIASGSSDFTVRVWDAQTGQSVMALTGHDDAVESVAFSPDGKSIVSGSQDKTIRIWDAQRDWSVMAEIWSLNIMRTQLDGLPVIIWSALLTLIRHIWIHQ